MTAFNNIIFSQANMILLMPMTVVMMMMKTTKAKTCRKHRLSNYLVTGLIDYNYLVRCQNFVIFVISLTATVLVPPPGITTLTVPIPIIKIIIIVVSAAAATAAAAAAPGAASTAYPSPPLLHLVLLLLCLLVLQDLMEELVVCGCTFFECFHAGCNQFRFKLLFLPKQQHLQGLLLL
jgi:hypothetical protein